MGYSVGYKLLILSLGVNATLRKLNGNLKGVLCQPMLNVKEMTWEAYGSSFIFFQRIFISAPVRRKRRESFQLCNIP